MQNRTGTLVSPPKRPAPLISIFYFLFSIFFLAAGCGAPGEPLPPIPPIPQAITDLTAKQVGDGVLLSFTMPGKSTLGDKLPQVPAFEVLRGGLRADGAPDAKSFRVADTVPGALVSRYSRCGQVQFVDPVSPAELKLHSQQPVIYRVRTLISDRHPSASSPDVAVRLYSVPQAISSVDAAVTEQGIVLKWTAPARTSSGDALAGVREYHVYRGELNSPAANPAGGENPQTLWKSPPTQIGSTPGVEYRDSTFDFGKIYAYVVRCVVDSPAGALESSDSPQAIVIPKDTFPPAAPQGIVAALQPGAAPDAVLVELSWAINVEPDLAGYRVYRGDQEGARGALLTPDLLPSPEYRDNSVRSGQHYWYTVTAVDRAGNESVPSPQVAVEVAQPSR